MSSAEIVSWPRPRYEAGGGDPFLFYVVYGDFPAELKPARSKYRMDGVPDGVDVMRYDDEMHPEVRDGFQEGYLWDCLVEENAALADAVRRAPACLAVKGAPSAPASLDYLRDAVGFMTYLLDAGGAGIFDPLMFKWWSPAEWRARIFDPGEAVPHRHVTILVSDEEDPSREWFHTRGMLKFGRPDLSVHAVTADRRDAVLAMINQLIYLQAEGGVLKEGQQLRVAGLPDGLSCHHGGSLDDPDFNNVHIEIRWP